VGYTASPDSFADGVGAILKTRRLEKTWWATLGGAVCLAVVIGCRSRAGNPPPGPTAEAPLAGGVRTPEYPPLGGPRFTGANVVLVTVDTLRRDHLAPYGAPFETVAASRLAREGVVFEDAVSHVPLTLPSHASLFTGLLPRRHGVRDNGGFVLGQDATTLAELLLRDGYRTAGFVGSYVLHSRWGIAQGYETYDDSFDYSGLESRSLTDVERPAGSVVDRAIEWLRAKHRGERPFHLWVHLYDPHEPYAPPEEYRRRARTAYAGEVMYADAQVARLLEALDALSLRRNTVVVALADHGESLGEHGESTHGIFLYGATLDVPLIIAPPTGAGPGSFPLALAGRRVSGLARLVDVTPTVLDLVGLPVPEGLDGASLLPMLAHERAPTVASAPTGSSPATKDSGDDPPDALDGPVSFAETYYPRFHYGWNELFAVETGRWKLVRAPRPELYDLRSDPRELHDVKDQHPRVAATLAAQLGAAQPRKAGEEPAPGKVDPEALERLKALGYVGDNDATATSAARREGPRPDPKDQLPLLRELLQAQALRDEGMLDEARRRLEGLVRKDPGNPGVHLALSSVYFRQKNASAAIEAARRAVALDPGSSVAVLDLAFAYQAQGRVDEAAAGFERVLQLDPENLKALVNLAEIHGARGQRERAFELYQRAAVVSPRLAPVQVNLGNLALQTKRLDVAEQAFRAAVALGASPPGLHFNLGVVAEQRGRARAARSEYRAEVAAHPESFQAWVNLGLLERQAERSDAALLAFERAAAAGKDEMAGPYLMAETLAGLGRRADAQRWAREALRRSPSDPRARQLVDTLTRR
jgi:choline-sulfatase